MPQLAQDWIVELLGHFFCSPLSPYTESRVAGRSQHKRARECGRCPLPVNAGTEGQGRRGISSGGRAG